jgi:Xylose isomerase-like TIM barrel
MVDFSLKAAAIDPMQLEARAQAMSASGLPICLELHTFGARDIDVPDTFERAVANVDRLKQAHPVDALVVHVPLQSVPVVTARDFDIDQCLRGIEFADRIGAKAIVLHRYWALVFGENPRQSIDKRTAEAAFNEVVKSLARAANGKRLLVENVGHYSLLPRDGKSYLAGPLDHFFPWEIARFRAFVQQEKLDNVEPFIDVAHATLSANLFNRKRAAPPGSLLNDPRFVGIDESDLDEAEWLNPLDFVDDPMPYLHASDAIVLERDQIARADFSDAELTRSIVSEGLEIGEGSLPFDRLPAFFGQTGTIVLEVDPARGETHVENRAQCRSLEALRRIYAN